MWWSRFEEPELLHTLTEDLVSVGLMVVSLYEVKMSVLAEIVCVCAF